MGRSDAIREPGQVRVTLEPRVDAGVAWRRLPMLILAFIALIAGIGAGLARFGFTFADVVTTAASLHGPLMICGFFGVVISLERAVALGRAWAYLGPLVAGAASIAAIAGASTASPWLFAAGSLVLLAATIDIFRRQSALFSFTLVAGSLAWTVGNLLWATGSNVHVVVTWWLAFLILTIAGERLELSRFLKPSRIAEATFAAILVVVGAGLAGAERAWGGPLFAAGLLALSIWLMKQDLARRTVRATGLTRYIAVCLLSGYAWLATGAVVTLAVGGLVPGTPSYDAAVHALALGFALSMVFGHAPIIFPAVLHVPIPYSPTFYVPLVLLHLSLVVRLAGDAADRSDWTRAGGLLNAVALATFILGTAIAAASGLYARRAKAALP